MTQVDLGLSNVNKFDSADRSLALMMLIKNLGCHKYRRGRLKQTQGKPRCPMYLTPLRVHVLLQGFGGLHLRVH
jgi:hypothetical protein